ncbi:hypothetical protein Gorai_024905, partial [Gossypium raimondii]|nr:hypothetical protein [Gossypium raimondii]
MSECQDGLIDAIQDSTAITISNCHFTHHNKWSYWVQVTFTLKINTCKSQLPSIILARNCTYPTIISQGNKFIASDDPLAKE